MHFHSFEVSTVIMNREHAVTMKLSMRQMPADASAVNIRVAITVIRGVCRTMYHRYFSRDLCPARDWTTAKLEFDPVSAPVGMARCIQTL